MKKKDTTTYDVIIIGGGPAGMMSAITAAKRGLSVVLLEKNAKLGEKLKITGGGRCNITNAEFDKNKFLKNYGDSGKFLHSPFSQFGVQDTFDFFESVKLPLVIEARKRTFPETQKASDVFKVLKKQMDKAGVKTLVNTKVLKIRTEENEIIGVKTESGDIMGKNVVIATGGISHKETGSTGDGFKFLEKLGHKIKKPTPDLVPLATEERWVEKISGTSLSFMKITFLVNDKKAFSKKGKILFTHFGLSGPLIINSSKQVKDLLYEGEVTAKIDMYPDTDLGSLEKTIIKEFDKNKNKDLKNVIPEISPKGMLPAFEQLLPKNLLNTKVHSITIPERKMILELLKELPLTISGLMGMERAIVSDGGINLEDVDMKTMRSKIHPNLYVTGDVLNINRPSGGFSLQLCWTTGFVVGNSIEK